MDPRTMNRFQHWLRQIRPVALACALGGLAPLCAAEEIRILTEENPPYNMTQNGKMVGLCTDMVNAVLRQVGVKASIQSMPWARAYDTALHEKNVMIYSIVRTPAREKLFKWVGTLVHVRSYLFSMANKNITLKTLDDARKYQIATVNEDSGEQYLMDHGFERGKNLQSSASFELNYQKLKAGRVDLWINDEIGAPYFVRQEGDDPQKVLARRLLLTPPGSELDIEIAFSPQTDDATVATFRRGLAQIRERGVYDTILKKWL